MINKIEPILNEIVTRLQTAGVQNVLRIPDEISHIGNYYPMALLEEGAKEYLPTDGQRYMYSFQLIMHICTDATNDQTLSGNDLEVAIMNAIFSPNVTLGGLCMKVDPVGVNPNAPDPIARFTTQFGLNTALNVRDITIRFTIQDAR